ncbi:hypothetical protein IGB42_00754 [Andreprevotia sp. IGB-42]|uniref:STAS domain-containing protein n=1 Tax=Andreprevotia sp. IGB-42 TaxID=2497473 RepID=UPI001357562B|nr:STAS domain-containing protein [Andreprevotia sp. IGB-42]KAF0814699.1 hypothetical protein IGB42_00754 [Andreprevotia sp. IGB-42]
MTTVKVGGRLTFDTAAQRLDEMVWPSAGDTLTLDFSGVEAADSAGVSVLLHWLRAAAAKEVTLQLSHMPPGLQQLASVYGLAGLPGFAPAA